MIGVAGFFKGKVTLLLVLSVIAWVFGGFQGYSGAGAQYQVFPGTLPLFTLAICIFALSFLFFGFLSPVALFFVGINAGMLFTSNTITPKLVILAFSTFAAAYAAIRLGDALLDDMMGAGNFNRAAKISAVCIIVSLAVAALWDFGVVV